ncbi:hypothetical protein SUGI_0274650 [Cryptomeria japonica]|nr:hypothetical protein SUGI_0274650 [Cryptomeria japonica]
MEAAMGAYVADYVDENCGPNSPISWKRVGEWQSDNSVKVADILKSRKIHIMSENDSLIWNPTKSVRDEKGTLVGAVCGPVGIATNNIAEITALEEAALEEGLKRASSKGVSKVMIEGDSQVILSGIIKKGFRNWRLNAWILRINCLLQKLTDYHLHHTFHEGNQVADFLANQDIAETLPTVMSSIDAGNRDFQNILTNDRAHFSKTGIG